MPAVCLPKAAVDKFRAGFSDGSLNPDKLASMSSEDRHKLFSGMVGEDASKLVNSNFESKLLLKNQQKGMITWAKSVAGLKPEVRRDLITRIEKMDKVLNPGGQEQFLKDLASTKLGTNVSRDEAKTISDLSSKVQSTREAVPENAPIRSPERLAYGRAQVELSDYVSGLKRSASKMSLSDAAKHPIKALGKGAMGVASNAKAINASFDESGIFRPGFKTLFTHPGIWAKNSLKSITGSIRAFGSDEVLKELRADEVSRPNFINGRYTKAGVELGNMEEAFPTSAPEKIPLVGRLYRATEAGFTILQQRNRMDLFDHMINIAEKSKVNVDDPVQLKGIGHLVNSLTGRGNLGAFEKVGKQVNVLLFSPKMMKSNIDTLTAGFSDKAIRQSSFARKQAAKSTLEIIGGIASVIAISNALKKNSVELNPKSSDFGKIKVGHTRFDITGGMGGLITLAARLATNSSKSTTTGQTNPLNSGKIGAQTGMDVVNNFFEGKASPVGQVIKDLFNRHDYNGNPVSVKGEAGNLFTPLGVKNYQELKSDPKSANILAAMLADATGIATNTYGASQGGKSPWEGADSKQLGQFKSKVGDQKFKQASDQYNTQLNKFMDSIVQKKDYQDLSTADQKTVITQEKAKLQADIFKQNGFKYKQEKSNSKQLKKFLQ